MNALRLSSIGLLLCLISPPPVEARTCRTEERGTSIFFVNGVWNDLNGAIKSATALKAKIKKQLETEGESENESLQFYLAFNPGQGGLDDLLEAARQSGIKSFKSKGFNTARLWGEMLSKSVTLPLFLWKGPEPMEEEEITQVHAQAYEARLMEGDRVIIVAHSQGNFFANAAYDLLKQGQSRSRLKSLRIISVATPAPRVAGGGPHFTVENDGIMKLARKAIEAEGGTTLGTMNENTSYENSTRGDILGHHAFLKEYLDGTETRTAILEAVEEALRTLPRPANVAQKGIITVTLSWGRQPDVDLHIYEPSGRHVYYKKKRGKQGYLDVDDTDGRGPEHYYVSCNKLTPGTYRIGVNYYKGKRPETARVQVQAGNALRTKRIELNRARGPRGDNSMKTMFLLEVDYDERRDLYQFEIKSP